MITKIEQAIVARLTAGLGQMVRTVKSYNGEAEDLGGQIHTLPAVWVTYGGGKIECVAAGRQRYQNTGKFVVMAATRSLRNELAQRQGGIDQREIGSNELIYAVRRLLDGQRLGFGDSRGLMPSAVRPVVNHTLVANDAVSIFAIEYALCWDSRPLEEGRFPEHPGDPTDPDHVFTKYQGELSEPLPMLEQVTSRIFNPESGAETAADINLKGD